MTHMEKLQFITHAACGISYYESADLALAGGCRWVQLRMKDCPPGEVEETARRVQALCKNHGAIFIIDDHVELARRMHADGVHLGKNDMPVAEARRMLGNGCIIGGTANTFEDIRALHEAGADYIGCGPFRYTATKKNLAPLLGIEGYRRLLAQMEEASIRLPLIAIGGITAADIPAILQAGASGIALSGAILRAADPVAETKKIIHLLKEIPQ